MLYPGLATLLSAKTVIARKGASTRKLNKQAEAKGEAPTHGRVGKARKRKAEKDALAASTASTTAAPAGAPTATATVAPVATSVAPAPAAPSVSGVSSSVAGPVNGVTNGTSHS